MADYKDMGLEEIARDMDRRYADEDAYAYELPWDIERHQSLHSAAASLVRECLNSYRVTGLGAVRATDLGCGMKSAFLKDAMVEALSPGRIFRPVDLTLVDLSKEAVRRLEDAHGEELRKRWNRVQFEALPAERLHERVNHQELIVSVESIEHWSDVDAGLEGVRQALVPGGHFVLTTPNRDSLHVRMARQLGFEPPFCAHDHTYEFGYKELDRILASHGFELAHEAGVGFAPYWAMGPMVDPRVRALTDSSPDVIAWMQSIGSRVPEFSFCQAKAYRRAR